jgi:hypothetical protein
MAEETKTTEQKPENKVLRTATYTVKMMRMADGSQHMERRNDGFSLVELMGVLSLTQLEILEMFKGNIKVDTIKRQVVQENTIENEGN